MVLFWPVIVLMNVVVAAITVVVYGSVYPHYGWSGGWSWFLTGKFEPRNLEDINNVDSGMLISWLLGGLFGCLHLIPLIHSDYAWVGEIYLSGVVLVYLLLIVLAKTYAYRYPDTDYESILARFLPWHGDDFRVQWWAYALNWPIIIVLTVLGLIIAGASWAFNKTSWIVINPSKWVADKVRSMMRSTVLKNLTKPVKRQVIEAGKHAYRSVCVREEIEMVPINDKSNR